MDDTWSESDVTSEDLQSFLQALSLHDKPRSPLLAVASGQDGAARLVLVSRALFGLFGVTSAGALSSRLLRGSDPGAKRLATLYQTVSLEGAPRLERLRFFLGPGSEVITFLCRKMAVRGRPVFIAAALGLRAGLLPAIGPTERTQDRPAGRTNDTTPAASLIARPDLEPPLGPTPNAAVPDPEARDAPIEASATEEPVVEATAPPPPDARGPVAEAPARPEVQESNGQEAGVQQTGLQESDHQESGTGQESGPGDPGPKDAAALQAALRQRWPAARTLRFLWHTDADSLCTLVTPPLAEVVGHETADLVGRSLTDLAPQLDPSGRFAARLASRETWSGLDLQWPLAGAPATVMVIAGAIPAFDADGAFDGFRGFGVIHLDRLSDAPPTRFAPANAAASPVNVVPFPAHALHARSLSTDEEVAFKAIGEALRQEVPEPAAPVTPAPMLAPVSTTEGLHGPAEPDGTGNAVVQPDAATPDVTADVGESATLEAAPALMAAEPAPNAVESPARGVEDGGRAASVDENREATASDDDETPVREEAGPEHPAAGLLDGPTTRDEALGRNGLTILDRLSLGLLVSRNNVPIFANRHLLDMLGFADEMELQAAGGMMHLFGGLPGNATGSEAISLRGRDGSILQARARMQAIDWNGHPATLLTLRQTAEGRPLDDVPPSDLPPGDLPLGDLPHSDLPNGDLPLAGLTPPEKPATNPPPRDMSGEDDAPVSSLRSSSDDVALNEAPERAADQARPDRDDAAPRQDAELRELRAILETATDGVAVLDADCTVLSLNRSGEALFGCDRSEVIGKPFLTLFAPHNQSLAADYCEGLKSNATKSLLNDGREFLIRAHQGGTIPVFMTLGRLGPSSGAQGAGDAQDRVRFCALFRDLTHWKKVERELDEARQEAERASALKSDFLAKVSHEIRTPLNAIIGFAEVIMDERFGPVGNERYKDYLRDIHRSGTHVMSLVNDLLDLSKIEAGKMELNAVALDANTIISECVGLMQPQASQERVIMRLSLAAALPKIRADERSLRQIVLNLLSNAVKFNEPGGQVIVATARTESGQVVIRIRDTGPGMSDKDIEAALEPFRQLSASRPMMAGTGLGLPLTKALVEANQASFTIRSKVDQGTLVEVAFPPAQVLAD